MGVNMQTETRSREYLRALVETMYTPKTPHADGTRVFVAGMWGTIVGHRFTDGNNIDPVYVVMFNNGYVNNAVVHHMIDIS